MKSKRKLTQKEKMPPGKEKPPKPQPGSSVSEREAEEDLTVKQEERDADNDVLAPDGEPDLKKEPPPLF